MKKPFARRSGPLIAAVIKEKTAKDAINAVKTAEEHGAQAADVHISTLEEGEADEGRLASIFEAASVPAMALHYNYDWQGEKRGMSDEARMLALETAARAGADCIDLQGYTFGEPDPRGTLTRAQLRPELRFAAKMPKEVTLDPEVIGRQMAYIDRIHQLGTDVLLSEHIGVNLNCSEMCSLVAFLAERNPDVIKAVGLCDTDDELAEYFKTVMTLRSEFPDISIHYHCNGRRGPVTRAVGPLLGSYLMFCNDIIGPSSDPNQLDLRSMTEVYRILREQNIAPAPVHAD